MTLHQSVGMAWLRVHSLLTGPACSTAAIALLVSLSLLGLLPHGSRLCLMFSLLFLPCIVLWGFETSPILFSSRPRFSRWTGPQAKSETLQEASQPWALKGFPGVFIHSFVRLFVRSFRKTFPEHLLVSSTVLDLWIWHEQHKVPAFVEFAWWRRGEKNMNNNNRKQQQPTNHYVMARSANFLERDRQYILIQWGPYATLLHSPWFCFGVLFKHFKNVSEKKSSVSFQTTGKQAIGQMWPVGI